MGFLLVIVVLVALVVSADLAWTMYDRLHPVKYSGLTLEGLREHFEQFMRRGDRSAEMVVETSRSTWVFSVRKWFRALQSGVEYYVVFPTARSDDPLARPFVQILKQQGCTCGYGLARPRRHRHNLACRCSNLDEVMDVVRLGVKALLVEPNEITFTVSVKGPIQNGDVVCDGVTRRTLMVAAMDRSGRPYKRWQLPNGTMYHPGVWFGRLCRAIRGLFLPPQP